MDVIHSVFFPHFRAQMNAVPGMVTRFKFTPILTTKDMRDKMQNDKFDYVLLCNKICGAAHSNMQMKVTVVDKKEDYEAFLAAAKSMAEVIGLEKHEDKKPEGAKADTTNAAAPDTTKMAAVKPGK
jgi:cytochrome c oxidase subunit 2